MNIFRSKESLRRFVKTFKQTKPEATIGFVPTMGFLHEGHLSLIKAAREETDLVIISIFVNPTQFGPHEDFNQYPRDEKRDIELCRQEGVDICFIPSVEEMYPENFITTIHVSDITDVMCGKYRPGHFDGVTTVVAKLFHIVTPTDAYFGQKDGQQAIVIKKMVDDLDFDLTIHVQPTVREPDGLAMSSRNVYLSSQGRKKANLIYASLNNARQLARNGEKNVSALVESVHKSLSAEPDFSIQYIECRSLKNLRSLDTLKEPAILAVAVFLEKVRLIDNIILEPGD